MSKRYFDLPQAVEGVGHNMAWGKDDDDPRRLMAEVNEFLDSEEGGELGDFDGIERGELDERDRPGGDCWACERFAAGASVHESPRTAECCIGCDAAEVGGEL